MENPRRKNHGAKREILLNQREYKEFSALYYKFNSLSSISFLVEGLFALNFWPGDGCNAGEIGITATIFMCGVVVMAAIVGT